MSLTEVSGYEQILALAELHAAAQRVFTYANALDLLDPSAADANQIVKSTSVAAMNRLGEIVQAGQFPLSPTVAQECVALANSLVPLAKDQLPGIRASRAHMLASVTARIAEQKHYLAGILTHSALVERTPLDDAYLDYRRQRQPWLENAFGHIQNAVGRTLQRENLIDDEVNLIAAVRAAPDPGARRLPPLIAAMRPFLPSLTGIRQVLHSPEGAAGLAAAGGPFAIDYDNDYLEGPDGTTYLTYSVAHPFVFAAPSGYRQPKLGPVVTTTAGQPVVAVTKLVLARRLEGEQITPEAVNLAVNVATVVNEDYLAAGYQLTGFDDVHLLDAAQLTAAERY